jgi:hypothetical protein
VREKREKKVLGFCLAGEQGSRAGRWLLEEKRSNG